MAPKESADRVVERMLGTSFPEASYSVIQDAARATADVALRREPTEADARAFAARFQDRLLPVEQPPTATPRSGRTRQRRPDSGRRPWSPFWRSAERDVRQGELLREERERREARRQEALIAAGQRSMELLSRAMDDPYFAATMFIGDAVVPPEKQRQFLYVRAMYENMVLAWATGAVLWENLFVHVRAFLQNPFVREYWEVTRAERVGLAADSPEARVASMIDSLLRDLEESETDEWWVVGQPPGEQDF
ncbi:DUF6082 family protein [Streptomyces kanamyceticus]|uniref:Putative membrane protein n=1 Tax=Streptomyces kanamyceticus TaxID=1967 RepID=Q1EQP2_STRKN|nr:DUF6082 family protein [Streptomyces kanamyceticus]QEU90517.1 hypothetical protein CP970_05970 [Streptomyces kanamyceticus]BAE95478.1 putative membrane protein [Streptomyces kanamyceticus]